jgi:hypothetical protein
MNAAMTFVNVQIPSSSKVALPSPHKEARYRQFIMPKSIPIYKMITTMPGSQAYFGLGNHKRPFLPQHYRLVTSETRVEAKNRPSRIKKKGNLEPKQDGMKAENKRRKEERHHSLPTLTGQNRTCKNKEKEE